MSLASEAINRNQEAIRKALDMVRSLMLDYLNGIGESPDDLILRLKEVAISWKKIRQVINNDGFGVLVGTGQLTIFAFPLSGDPMQDVGQKKTETTLKDMKIDGLIN